MTTGAKQEFETGAAVPEAARAPLRDLLVACADTKLLMGYHYGEWTFGTPTLEAAVANCSLAQSELGHVRLLHGILKTHYDEDLDLLLDVRPADAFGSVAYLDEPLPDWSAVVAMNFVIDLAVTRVIHAMRNSTFVPVRACVEKLLEEERYHLHHGHGWFRALAAGGDASRPQLIARVEPALAAVRAWFGPDGSAADHALVALGIKAASDQELATAVVGDVVRVARPLGIDLAMPAAPEPDEWDPARRRSGGGGPSQEVLYHLRGTKNAIFRLT